jgi:aminomethyltransferase
LWHKKKKAMQKTIFHPQHLALSAKMTPFAGYDMPLHYASGILQEHQQVRQSCGLFDVSHMGVCMVVGAAAAENLSRLTPTDFSTKPVMSCTYTVLTNNQGGIVDDLIVTKLSATEFYVVINAGTKDKDLQWLKENLHGDVTLRVNRNPGLLAIQGPKAQEVLQHDLLKHENISGLKFMTARPVRVLGYDCILTRTGYTGEDGFELLCPNEPRAAVAVWEMLLRHPALLPCGLGCRDSLRLEAGFPLYGHDLNDLTTPVEANLSWVITKGHKGYIGSDIILKQLAQGPTQKRVGIKLLDKGIAREGAAVLNTKGEPIGQLCSGGFSPTLKESIGMAYLPTAYTKPGTEVAIDLRGRVLRAKVTSFNFIKKDK